MLIEDFLLRISLAVLFGFAIGLERQLTGHIAGIRTNVLVSLGSSLFTLFSMIMVAPDVTRIAAQVVTGVGFLCSGIIIKVGANVRGINTAATIWCTAAIGVITSSGYTLYGSAATLLVLIINLVFRFLAKKIRPLRYFDDDTEYLYQLVITCPVQEEVMVRSSMLDYIQNANFSIAKLKSAVICGQKVEIEAAIVCGAKDGENMVENLVKTISTQYQVSSIGWEKMQ